MPGDLVQYFTARSPTDLGRDVLDVLITYYIFYRVALVLKGTRAMQVGLGLVGVFVVYVVAQVLRLHTVLTLLGAVLSSAILIGVVVFQNDIRRGLMRVGAGARFGSGLQLEAKVIDAVVEAATTLARHRIGAIITFEQDANLDEFVGSHTGQAVDAAVSPELLVNLFIPEGMNKLHDGAVVIRDLRIAKAGVFFPMPEGGVKDESFGSRHRAAMGITEETDAVVIVVSEERGSISFCFNGNIIPNLDGPRLRAALDGVFAPKRKPRRQSWLARWLGARPAPVERHVATLVTKPASLPDDPLDRVSELPASNPPDTRPQSELAPVPLRKRPVAQDTLPVPTDRDTAIEPIAQPGAGTGPDSQDRPTLAEVTEVQRRATRTAEEVPLPLRRNPEVTLKKAALEESTKSSEEESNPALRDSDPSRLMPRTEESLRSAEPSPDGARGGAPE